MNSAYSIRETRLQAIAIGKVIPGVNDRRSSGLFSGDFSDTSSISSTGSGNRFRKLRDTTDIARASLDSLRRGSKESLDDLFKRGLSITRGASEELERKRASTGDMMTRSFSQKLSMANNLAAKVRRTSSVRSANTAYLSPRQQSIDEQIHRDWLLANQLNAVENNTHIRQNSISSNVSSTTSRSSSLMNRFSQFVSSKPVAPYRNQTQQDHVLKRSSSHYSASDPLQTREEKNQLSNNLNTREQVVAAYRGFI